jgi:multicomponent Na+:H+ antiporter subunit B
VIEPFASPILQLTARLLSPVIQVFGIYVVFHGHYSPGGGFQGGVILGASVLLTRMCLGEEQSQVQFPARWAIVLCALGVLMFAATGLFAVLAGEMFLDYRAFAFFGVDESAVRYFAILWVEIVIAIAVMGAIIAIYDNLVETPEHDGPR